MDRRGGGRRGRDWPWAAGGPAPSSSPPCCSTPPARCASTARRSSRRSPPSAPTPTSMRPSRRSTIRPTGSRRGSSPTTCGASCRAFERLEVGGLVINDVPGFRVDHAPYGGVKAVGAGPRGRALRHRGDDRAAAARARRHLRLECPRGDAMRSLRRDPWRRAVASASAACHAQTPPASSAPFRDKQIPHEAGFRVFIVPDMEGMGSAVDIHEVIAGNEGERYRNLTSPDYWDRFRLLLTQEVNATIRGARAGGRPELRGERGPRRQPLRQRASLGPRQQRDPGARLPQAAGDDHRASTAASAP